MLAKKTGSKTGSVLANDSLLKRIDYKLDHATVTLQNSIAINIVTFASTEARYPGWKKYPGQGDLKPGNHIR